MKKAQTLNREKIRDALGAMETMTIIGRYGDDRKTGKHTKKLPFTVQVKKGRNENSVA